jgi:hypothetical protein
MPWHAHPDASKIVRKHWHEAQCFIIAEQEPCVTLAEDEVGNIGTNRQLISGTAANLLDWNPPKSWYIAVVVCRGDDTTTLVQSVRQAKLDPSRIHFYIHADGDSRSLIAWRDAGFPLDRVDDKTPDGRPIHDWKDLHKGLGLHFNSQIVMDFS